MGQKGCPVVAVYTVTRGRLDLTRKSFKRLRHMAGCEIRHYVVDNGSDPAMRAYLRYEKSIGHIHWLHLSDVNLGQNIAANMALDQMEADGGYEWTLRWDNDAIPQTRRFLRKLVRCAEKFKAEGVIGVFSPKITNLKHPPQAFGEGEDVGFKYEVVQILGGICRLHHFELFKDFRFNKFGALGFGEATEIADECLVRNMPKIRVPHLEVEHAYGEDGQAERWPEYFSFEQKEIPRYVGYGLG